MLTELADSYDRVGKNPVDLARGLRLQHHSKITDPNALPLPVEDVEAEWPGLEDGDPTADVEGHEEAEAWEEDVVAAGEVIA